VRLRKLLRPRDAGGIWQIIYMDLMTTMMVFFVILWSAEQGAADQQYTGISHTIGDQTVRMVHLPGDILFASGRAELAPEGSQVFQRLFGDDAGAVLDFDQGGLARRQLVIHGHTDEVGDKDENFLLGYQRAYSVYEEIRRFSGEVPDHVVICTHADNTPTEVVPVIDGTPTDEQRQAIREARARNRRIAIEDQIINTPGASGPP
jgi:flagellar motor protein MotB